MIHHTKSIKYRAFTASVMISRFAISVHVKFGFCCIYLYLFVKRDLAMAMLVSQVWMKVN